MTSAQIELYQELVDCAIGATHGIIKALFDRYGAIIWKENNLIKMFMPIAENMFNGFILDAEINSIYNPIFLKLMSIDVGKPIHFRCLVNLVVQLSISAIDGACSDRLCLMTHMDHVIPALEKSLQNKTEMISTIVGCDHSHPEILATDRLFEFTINLDNHDS